MFVMAIVLWTLDLVNFIMETKITLIGNSEDDIDVKLNNALIFTHRLEAAQNVLYAYMVSTRLMPNFRVINRLTFRRCWEMRSSYIASGSSRHFRAILGCYSCLARFFSAPWVRFPTRLCGCSRPTESSVASIMLTNCVVQLGPVILQESYPNPLCEKIQAITYVMPCANTLVATILIGITMWYVSAPSPMNETSIKLGNIGSRFPLCSATLSARMGTEDRDALSAREYWSCC
jgi:hypothetical protein